MTFNKEQKNFSEYHILLYNSHIVVIVWTQDNVECQVLYFNLKFSIKSLIVVMNLSRQTL